MPCGLGVPTSISCKGLLGALLCVCRILGVFLVRLDSERHFIRFRVCLIVLYFPWILNGVIFLFNPPSDVDDERVTSDRDARLDTLQWRGS